MSTKKQLLATSARTITLPLLIVALGGCCPTPSDDAFACRNYEGGSWPASYSGALHGRGYIELSHFNATTGDGDINIVVTQTLGSAENAKEAVVIRVSGVAKCSDNQLTAHFGASAGQNDIFKVVGGKMVGMLSPTSEFGPYGVWQMQLVHLESLEIHTVSGSWSIHRDAKPK